MKKLVLLFACMFLLLLGGGRYADAGLYQIPNSHAHTYEGKHRVKFTSQSTDNSFIEDADLDLSDEDFSGEIKGGISDNLLIKNYSFLDSWYLALSCQSLLSQCQSFKFFEPFAGQSNPIYITQRVLRI